MNTAGLRTVSRNKVLANVVKFGRSSYLIFFFETGIGTCDLSSGFWINSTENEISNSNKSQIRVWSINKSCRMEKMNYDEIHNLRKPSE